MNRAGIIVVGVVAVILLVGKLVYKNDQVPKQESSSAISSTLEAADVSVDQLFAEANRLAEDKDRVGARNIYKKIINDFPDYENVEKVQKDLEKLNMEIIFSNSPVEQSVVHEVVSGDTLGKLAKEYGTTIDLIKINNHLKSNIIRLGSKLRIWTGEFDIFVDKSQNILLLKNNGEVVKSYDVSTGENSSTPVGEFVINTRLVDPVWFNRGVVVPPESPENVLGSRWLGFDTPGYGIHGTVEPETIGQQVTAGCVRMRNNEVEELYSIIPIGTKVSIVD